jgi:hypothetical protein
VASRAHCEARRPRLDACWSLGNDCGDVCGWRYLSCDCTMKCEACHGRGVVLRRSYPGNELFPYPCEICGGSGLAHCCEGERPGNIEDRSDFSDVRPNSTNPILMPDSPDPLLMSDFPDPLLMPDFPDPYSGRKGLLPSSLAFWSPWQSGHTSGVVA